VLLHNSGYFIFRKFIIFFVCGLLGHTVSSSVSIALNIVIIDENYIFL